MSDEEVLLKLDTLSQDLRKQGRAAVAAQAAAEACLAQLREQGEGSAPQETSTDLLENLLPVFDALDQAVAQARALPRPSRVARLLGDGGAVAAVENLTEGLRLLQRQLASALERSNVELIRPEGGPVDARLHRVVETQRGGGRPGHVVRVVRPGYQLGSRLLREAEVVAVEENA